VSQSQLTTRIRRELTRNPKKTAVLALLLAVAVWFWAPLVWDWIAPADQEDIAIQQEQEVTASAPVAPVETAATAEKVRSKPAAAELNWKNLQDLFTSHRLMATARLRAELAAPFGPPDKPETKRHEGEADSPTKEHERLTEPPTPEQLGLTLTSTVTGRGVQWAVINGRTCRPGTVLVVPYGNEDIELTVARIMPQKVQLKQGPRLQELKQQSAPTKVQLSQAGRAAVSGPDASGERVIIDSLHRE